MVKQRRKTEEENIARPDKTNPHQPANTANIKSCLELDEKTDNDFCVDTVRQNRIQQPVILAQKNGNKGNLQAECQNAQWES